MWPTGRGGPEHGVHKWRSHHVLRCRPDLRRPQALASQVSRGQPTEMIELPFDLTAHFTFAIDRPDLRGPQAPARLVSRGQPSDQIGLAVQSAECTRCFLLSAPTVSN